MSFIEITNEQYEEFSNTTRMGLFETVHIISQRGIKMTEYTHRCVHVGNDYFQFSKLIALIAR